MGVFFTNNLRHRAGVLRPCGGTAEDRRRDGVRMEKGRKSSEMTRERTSNKRGTEV